MDPAGTHHIFASGRHGQKMDFDKIPTHSELFRSWVDITAEYVMRLKGNQKNLLLFGVANGANRLAKHVAYKVPGTIGLETRKDEDKSIHLTRKGLDAIRKYQPREVLILDDVGTRGTNMAMVAREILDAGVASPHGLVTWQRSPRLDRLDELGVAYTAIIKEMMPDYSLPECEQLPEGFCHRWGPPIPHGS